MKTNFDVDSQYDAATTTLRLYVKNVNNALQVLAAREYLEERLADALLRGVTDSLDADLHEALGKYGRAVDIIEGPLMEGMNVVGRLFGEGKMFLPQVVKTARTMKRAVAILQPYIEAQRCGEAASVGKVLLATVKGDVHDIGKNIVSVVMACNGYEIVDLGVMVPPESIVEAVLREKPAMKRVRQKPSSLAVGTRSGELG